MPKRLFIALAAAVAVHVATSIQQAVLPFLLAADFSALPMEDCYGTCSRYKSSATSTPEDALVILKRAGLNAIRLRVWVGPAASGQYCNITNVAAMAMRAQRAGHLIWIDFHYADNWADPQKQPKPAAWSQLNAAALASALAAHTTLLMSTLVAQGTPPAVVQIGNEITNGFLWAEGTSSPCADSGSITGRCSDNWPAFAALVSSGVKAVRSAVPTAQVMIHTDLGGCGSTRTIRKTRGIYASDSMLCVVG